MLCTWTSSPGMMVRVARPIGTPNFSTASPSVIGRSATLWPSGISSCAIRYSPPRTLPRGSLRVATAMLSSGERRITGWCMASGLDHARDPGLEQHAPAALPVHLADVARRRPAARAVEADQLHAQLVEVAIARGVGLLDLDPQLVERHRLADEHELDLLPAPRGDVVDQPDAPLGPVVGEVDLKGGRPQH